MKAKKRYRIIKIEFDNCQPCYEVYVLRWFGWHKIDTYSFWTLKDAQHFIKLHSGEIPKYVTTVVYEE